MKSKTQLGIGILAVLLLSTFAAAGDSSQCMSHQVDQYIRLTVCSFSDGNVVETMSNTLLDQASTVSHTAAEWKEMTFCGHTGLVLDSDSTRSCIKVKRAANRAAYEKTMRRAHACDSAPDSDIASCEERLQRVDHYVAKGMKTKAAQAKVNAEDVAAHEEDKAAFDAGVDKARVELCHQGILKGDRCTGVQ